MNWSEYPRGGTFCASKAGLAEGTNTHTIKTAAPNGAGVDFGIGGLGYHLADGDNIAMSDLAVQAELTTCLYLVCVNSSGTVSMVKGTEILTADLAAGNKVLRWPAPTADTCPIGAIRIEMADGYTFTCGTTDLSATGVTDTYYDFVGGVPDAPLRS
jgi:hypothetical protein